MFDCLSGRIEVNPNPKPMKSKRYPRIAALFAISALGTPIVYSQTALNLVNPSFETERNYDQSAGGFARGESRDFGPNGETETFETGDQNRITGWTTLTTENITTAGAQLAVGFRQLVPAHPAPGSNPVPQALSVMAGASTAQISALSWSSLSVGDVITLTVATGDRADATIKWADQSFIGITDGLPAGTIAAGTLLANTVANSGEIAVPPTGIDAGTMDDIQVQHVVTSDDLLRTGKVGVVLAAFGTTFGSGNGLTADGSNFANYNQAFYDNVRLTWTFTDTDNDNLPDGYENSFIGISPPGDVGVVDLTSLSGLGGADFDGDGLSDLAEFVGPDGDFFSGDESRPDKADSDDDGLSDPVELAGSANIWTGTTTGSPPGDPTLPSNPDTDADGIPDGEETSAGADGFITNPALADSDGDGMPDSYEVTNHLLGGLDPTDPSDEFGDLDGDGLFNIDEYNGADSRPQTRADKADTDGDGLTDFQEDNSGVWFDSDSTGTNPTLVDSDGDGIEDGDENPDSGTTSTAPYNSNPNRSDTDLDGYPDDQELLVSLTDPADSGDYPDTPATVNGSRFVDFATTFEAGIFRRFTNVDAGKTFRLVITAQNSAFIAGATDDWIGAALNPDLSNFSGVTAGNANGMGFLVRSTNFGSAHQLFDTSLGATLNLTGEGGNTGTSTVGGPVTSTYTFTLDPDYQNNGEVSFDLVIEDDGPNSPYSASGTFLANNGAGGNLDLYLEKRSSAFIAPAAISASLSELVTASAELKITDVSFDGVNFTIQFTGDPNTTYDVKGDPDLQSGFTAVMDSPTTDGTGTGSSTFAVGSNRFFRVQTQ
jgi:hypothetical protein